jgi:hypothetical protein
VACCNCASKSSTFQVIAAKRHIKSHIGMGRRWILTKIWGNVTYGISRQRGIVQSIALDMLHHLWHSWIPEPSACLKTMHFIQLSLMAQSDRGEKTEEGHLFYLIDMFILVDILINAHITRSNLRSAYPRLPGTGTNSSRRHSVCQWNDTDEWINIGRVG